MFLLLESSNPDVCCWSKQCVLASFQLLSARGLFTQCHDLQKQLVQWGQCKLRPGVMLPCETGFAAGHSISYRCQVPNRVCVDLFLKLWQSWMSSNRSRWYGNIWHASKHCACIVNQCASDQRHGWALSRCTLMHKMQTPCLK